MQKVKIILIIVGSILAISIMVIHLVGQFGYKFNKEIVSFDKDQCISENYETKPGKSGIQGCVYWMRADKLEKEEGWKQDYEADADGCLDGVEHPVVGRVGAQMAAPKECLYTTYSDQRRKQNVSYLTSEEKDGYYSYCAEKVCPDPKLLK